MTFNKRNGGIWEKIETSTQTYEVNRGLNKIIRVLVSDNQLINNNADTVIITIKVVDGLEVARGTVPSDATVLDYDGDVNISVDGQQTTKTLTNGSVSFDLTTDKAAGSDIEIVAESLANHPAESDSAIIEVVSQ